MSSATQKKVLEMLRQARAKPKSASIVNTCGRPVAVPAVAALPMLYELEHGPAPTAAPAATTTLPVRTTATKTASTTAAKTTTSTTAAKTSGTKTTGTKTTGTKTAGTGTGTRGTTGASR
ncbi:hypothetical protein B0I37DRAFT_115545 [Chaetomium sp. MPI-CAGE-AT-0009]|nr:hypothetical protein B0I37DRAFT_115545 [Chaetomium sp. MPI-CAGE-AT-0009]